MGWFKSQMWKVLEWADDSKDTMVYRFDMQGKEIMCGSQLTVRESQVGVFVHQGKLADIFMPGRHKLETANIPILSGLGALLYQDRQPRFKAELYFVNTKQFTDQKWGTTSPITMRDADFGVIRIKAFGNFSFKVSDPAVFLKEVFGTNSKYMVSDIVGNLKNVLVTVMSDTIAESKVPALDMASNMIEFGEMVKSNAVTKFASLGLLLCDFNIANINFPESVEKALDERSSLGILGDKMGTYTQKKAADALGDLAKNTGSAGTFMGVGLGNMAGGMMGQTMTNLGNAQDTPKQSAQGKGKFCSQCGATIKASAKFCPECGVPVKAGGCPQCGADIKDSAKFCPECGTKLK